MNGSGSTASITDTFNAFGQLTQHADELGTTTTYAYDDYSGAMTQTIVDTGSGHLNLTTTVNSLDTFGRPLQVTDPDGRVTYYRYDDVKHEA